MTAPNFTDPASVPVWFKPGKFSKKTAWRSIRLADVPEMVESWSPSLFASGQLALWVSAKAETEAGVVYVPWIDVESPGRHDDLSANIETAQNLFLRMSEAGIDDGLTVILTGRGFRFCWNFAVEPEFAPAFVAMLRDHAAWPGVDDGPQVTGLPLAMSGYRGHRSQGAKGDVHFHALADASDLLTLTPPMYHALVAGHADLARAVKTINNIMPRSWTPPAWSRVLDGYRRELALRANILRMDPPRQPERPAAVPWSVIEEHLAGQGIRVTRELDLARGVVRSLSACPICGRANKAFLAGGARLKCFSSGCEAGQVQVDLRGESFRPGLPLSQWAPGIVPAGAEDDAEPAAEIHREDDDTDATLEDARAKIREALAGEDNALLVEVTAGVGKTHAAMAYAVEQAGQGRTVLFAVPSLVLADEIHGKLTEAVRHDYNILTPPRLYSRRCKQNCRMIVEVNEAVKYGYSPGLLFCLKCFYKGHCSYLRQFEPFERGGIVVASHDAMPTVAGKLPPDVLIIDENPLNALFDTECVPFGNMASIRAHIVGDAETAFDKITAAAFGLHRAVVSASMEAKKKTLTGRLYAGEFPRDGDDKRPVPPQSLWEVAGLTDAERQALVDQLYFFLQWEDESVSSWQWRLYFDLKVNLLSLMWLWSALDIIPGQQAYISASAKDHDPIQYCYTCKQPIPGAGRIIALDATPDVKELNTVFHREFKVVKATVPPKKGARLVHVKVAMGKTKATRLADVTLLGYLKKAHAYLKPTDRKVLLLTHQKIEKKLFDMARQLDPSREWAICHHFAAKGLNTWAHFDAGVVIGTPTPPAERYFDKAVAIHGNNTKDRDNWFSGLGMRDLIQSISRLRPVLRPKTVIVVGRSEHWPTEALGAPSFTVDESRKGASGAAIEEAYKRLLPLARKLGVMFTEAAALAGVFLASDKEGPAIWREWVKPILAGESTLELTPTLRKIFIRVSVNSDPLSPEPIILSNRGHAWPELVARLADAAALPECTYKPGRRGRPQAACGSAAAVRALCESFGREFLPEIWDFPTPPPASEETEAATVTTTPMPPVIRPPHATIHRRAIRPWLPPAMAVEPVLPPGLPTETYFPPLAQRMVAGMVAV